MIFDSQLHKGAGLSVQDVASLYDVSRMAAHNYMNREAHHIHPMIRKKAVAISAALKKAIAASELPLTGKRDKERIEQVRQIVRKYMAVK